MSIIQMRFRGVSEPPAELLGRVSDIAPENPFCTVEYARVREKLGYRTFCLVLEQGDSLVSGCLAFLSTGRLNSRLEITSLPLIADRDLFWSGLFAFCREQGITILSVLTFGSIAAEIPFRRNIIFQKRRSEYRLDLTQPDLWQAMNRRTHRLVKKARAAGLELRKAEDAASFATHCELANMSLDRRRGKGEPVDSAISPAEVAAFIESGFGEVYQAVGGGNILSSLLVARSRKGCYAQSSGTADEGRNIGASHFLFHEIACLMKSEGLELFNVGGADEHSVGLQDFKHGLGADRIELQSAEYFMGNAVKRLAARAVALLRR